MERREFDGEGFLRRLFFLARGQRGGVRGEVAETPLPNAVKDSKS